MKSKQNFSFSVSHERVAVSLVNLQNVFRLIASGVKTDASTWSLLSNLFRTYWPTLDRAANFLQSKRVFSRNPKRDLRESRYKSSQACRNLACKPPRNARTRTTLGHFQTVHLRANSGQTDPGQNGGHDRGWSARRQQLSDIMYIIYTNIFSPNVDEPRE